MPVRRKNIWSNRRSLSDPFSCRFFLFHRRCFAFLRVDDACRGAFCRGFHVVLLHWQFAATSLMFAAAQAFYDRARLFFLPTWQSRNLACFFSSDDRTMFRAAVSHVSRTHGKPFLPCASWHARRASCARPSTWRANDGHVRRDVPYGVSCRSPH